MYARGRAVRVITLPVRDSRDKPHPRSVGRAVGRSPIARSVADRAVGRAYSVRSSPIARSVARIRSIRRRSRGRSRARRRSSARRPTTSRARTRRRVSWASPRRRRRASARRTGRTRRRRVGRPRRGYGCAMRTRARCCSARRSRDDGWTDGDARGRRSRRISCESWSGSDVDGWVSARVG